MDLVWISLATALVVFAVYIYQYFTKLHSHWKNLNIPHLKPSFIFGNMYPVFAKGQPLVMFYKELHNQLSPHKFGGYFTMLKPTLLIRDPEIIKHVLTKDFHHFQSRGFKSYPKAEPITNHMFLQNGEEWKNLRIKLTPTFTSGKMKLMFPLVKECVEEMIKVLEDTTECDMKDLAARFTIDVIGTCAFGVQSNSLKNPDSDFRRIGKLVFKTRLAPIIRILFPRLPTFILQLFNLKFVVDEVHDFFLSLISKTVKYREETGTRRNDYLDLLIAMKNQNDEQINEKEADSEIKKLNELKLNSKDKVNNSGIDMTLELMTAQTFLFFAAGFETSSTTISYLLFELAQNPKVQLKLQEEVDKVMTLCNDDLAYYDVVREMHYLDMVLSETLRKYPPDVALQRVCTKTYKLPGSELTIPEGQSILISVIGLYHDPTFYPNPDTFNPENFTEEAKTTRPHYAYLPFGEGPRVCIAERFAKMVVKLAVAYLVRNYKFELSSKTQLPLKFQRTFGILSSEGGVWLHCKSRK